MTTLEARKAIVKDLEDGGYIKCIEPLKHDVGTCYRCHTDIEPMVSKQWFVKMDPLAGPAIEAVERATSNSFPTDLKELYELDARYERLVYFASALVGPPYTCVVLRRLRCHYGLKVGHYGLPSLRKQ